MVKGDPRMRTQHQEERAVVQRGMGEGRFHQEDENGRIYVLNVLGRDLEN